MFSFLKKYSLTIILVFIFVISFTSSTTIANAQAGATCTTVGQCVNNRVCISDPSGGGVSLGTQECGSSIIGGVEAPEAVARFNMNALTGGGSGSIGIIVFLSRLINFAAVIGGILVMINFVIAGFTYVTMAGNASAHEKVRERLTWSLVGILVIVSAYSIAGLIGLVFFGDASFILNPQLEGAI